MDTVKRVSALAVLAICIASGCAMSGPHTGANTFPAGRYQNGELIAVFNADGSFLGTTTDGNDWVKGTYAVRGNKLTLLDSWESDQLIKTAGETCVKIPGHYTWSTSGGVLTAVVDNDPCASRKGGMSGVPWSRSN